MGIALVAPARGDRGVNANRAELVNTLPGTETDTEILCGTAGAGPDRKRSHRIVALVSGALGDWRFIVRCIHSLCHRSGIRY